MSVALTFELDKYGNEFSWRIMSMHWEHIIGVCKAYMLRGSCGVIALFEDSPLLLP